MKATVIVTSFNYEKYAVECVNSVSAQTYQNIEIIFVDDGSSDNTVKLINDLKFDKLKVIEKVNGGQLSAFNTALPHITGDLIFFIDADDIYEADYLEKTIEFYKSNSDADFVYSGLSYFGCIDNNNVSTTTQSHGYTICRTYFLRHWIGAPTTAISMRKSVLDKILPLELELDWKVRADDCLVWGASLVGAKKYYFGGAIVKYRIHAENNFFGKQFNADYFFKRGLAINRMFNLIIQRNHITITSDLLILEFISHPEKNIGVLFVYLKMVFMLSFSPLNTVTTAMRLVKHYFNGLLASSC